MTDRELMQQALEALEDIFGKNKIDVGVINRLRDRLAQPEQEPVAWMHKHIENNIITHRPADLDRHPDRWEALYKTPPPCPTCEALARTVMMDQTSHDMAPRQWQGLTDEDVDEVERWIEFKEDGSGRIPNQKLVRYIERKLREKNNG